MTCESLSDIAACVMAGRGMAQKTDIADVVAKLGLGSSAIQVGDDCAAIPDGDGFLLFAIEGFVNDFVDADPYFAGYCGVMVNLSDIAAMGGRAIAVVDAVWARNGAEADPVLDGLRQASAVYGVPLVGGHTNIRSDRGQLAVAVLGRANTLITSFGAQDGDTLIAAVDLRGGFREPYLYWDASTGSPSVRLRADLEILPGLADAGLVTAGKDISMAGLVGSTMMLLESSRKGARLQLDALPCPLDVSLQRFLMAFPSYGFVLTARTGNAAAVISRFATRGIACARIGTVDCSNKLRLSRDQAELEVWDFERPFTGCVATNPDALADCC